MGEWIEFPHNKQMYLKQVTKHLEQKEYEKALISIEKLYEVDQSYYVNHFYTLILYALERYQDALFMAQEQKEFYLEDEQRLILYTMLLIKNHQFIEAELLIQQKNLTSTTFQISEWEKLARELNLERELVNFEMDMKKEKTKKQLAEISHFSMLEQAEIIEDAKELELKDLQVVATLIFANPFVSGQTQRSFLEVLVEKKDDTIYQFPWFNQQVQIKPRDLHVFSEVNVVKNIDQLLEEKLAKYPSLLEIIKVEVINDLLLLYPFIDETITDLDYWIDYYIKQFDYAEEFNKDVTPHTKEESKMKKQLEQLDIIAQRQHTLE